jgi:hypothetical protein
MSVATDTTAKSPGFKTAGGSALSDMEKNKKEKSPRSKFLFISHIYCCPDLIRGELNV